MVDKLSNAMEESANMTRNSTSDEGAGHDDSSDSDSSSGGESVSHDTIPRLMRDRSRGSLWKMLSASLVVHAFLTPGPALLGLISILPALELSKRVDFVEIELTALPIGPVAPKVKKTPEDSPPHKIQEAAQTPSEAAPSLPKEEKKEPPVKSPKVAKTTPQEARPPEAAEESVAFGDPVALAGKAGAIADSNANVRLFLFTDVVRKHPLAKTISSLLKRTPQWSDFFGPSGIDPILDIDRVMISGPQLRSTSQVVAVVQHRLSHKRIEEAFDGLVKRKGSWIDRGALIASARADRADRIFAAPAPHVVVVAPPQLESQIRDLDESTTFPSSNGDVAVTAYIVTPHRPLRDIGIIFPETIKWVRLDLRPTKEGGAVLKVLAEDIDHTAARNNAAFIQAILVQMTTGFANLRYVDSIKMRSDGKEILGEIRVTGDQLAAAALILEIALPAEIQESSPQEKPKKSGTSKTAQKSAKNLKAQKKEALKKEVAANEKPPPKSSLPETSEGGPVRDLNEKAPSPGPPAPEQ